MRILLAALAVTILSGCSAVGFPGVYRIDVEQGNIVTQEMADQLQPGMSRRQVRFILGTPLVEDTFNENRWDYSYMVRNGLNVLDDSSLIVIFEEDSLVEVRGDYTPPAWDTTDDGIEDSIEDTSEEEASSDQEVVEADDAS